MAARDDTRLDVYFAHSGQTLGFELVVDPQGNKQIFPSFVPENSLQFQQGAFSYDDRPKAASQAITFEDFSGGCGITDTAPGTTNVTSYSYTRGVDPSWGRLVISPEQQAFTAAAMTEQPTKFYRAPTGGWYALSATHVWQLTSGGWVSVYTAASPPTDIIEYGNATATYIFLALGDSTDMIYTTNNFVATTTVTGEKATYFCVRGVTSTVPVLFQITVSGKLRSSTNPILSANWSNADQIGSAGETVTAMTVANSLIYIFKEEGIYTFDGTNLGTQISTTLLKRTNNGKSTFTWINGFMYSNYSTRILEFDPFNNTTVRMFAPANPELNGTITAITADLQFLYFFLQNAAGNTYLLKLDIVSRGPVHSIMYLGAVTVNSALVIPANAASPSTTNDILAFGTGTTSKYIILPRVGYRPWEDTNCRFDLAGGTLYGSWTDCGAEAYPKWLNGARCVTLNSNGAQAATFAYQLNGDTTTAATTVLTGNMPGLQTAVVSTEVSLARIRPVVTLTTGADNTTPQVLGWMFDTTPNPPRWRQWEMLIDVGNSQRPRTGGSDRNKAFKELYSHLNTAVGKYVTFEDYFGDSYLVKVLDVKPEGVQRKIATGSGRNDSQANLRVTCIEIHANSKVDDPFIWGDASGNGGTPWSGGYEWSP